MPRPIAYIVDGHALAYRAFYALPPLTSPDGTPTGAIHGFLLKILKALRESTPDLLVVVFDGPGPTFRDKLSAEYKATRAEMPAELRTQLGIIVDLVPRLGIPTVVESGVEADDVIATLARRAAATHDIEILSGDKDLAALVDDRTVLLAPGRQIDAETRLDRAGILAKFGVAPENIPDLLALMGDKSDNIPGVPGIGKVNAAKLLVRHGSLDGVLAELPALAPGIRTKLETHRDLLDISRKLVSLHDDLALDFDAILRPPSRPSPEGLETIRALGMKNILHEFLKRTEAGLSQAESAGAVAVTGLSLPRPLILDKRSLPSYLETLSRCDPATIDTETTSLNIREARLLGISFGGAEQDPAYLALDEGDSIPEPVRRFLADESIPKCGHNIKYDIEILRAAGCAIAGFDFDTMVASSLLGPLRRSHGLDALALELFEHRMIPFESLGDIATAPLERVAEYSCEDAFVTARLASTFRSALATEGLERLYREIEHPLIFVLADMEERGVGIDVKVFTDLAATFREELDALEKESIRVAGEEFNPASSQQLGRILFEKLGLPAGRKTKTGYSTDAATLEELGDTHPLPRMILEYREIAKLLGTYIEALPTMLDPRTARVHTSYSQVRTATGRLSSTDPNLQNIPIRTSRGREIRKGFVAAPGKTFVAADYSQIEFRIIAMLAGESELMEAFERGFDVHAATASRIWGVRLDEVDADYRRKAKAVNFGILYGQSPFGLARSLGATVADARAIIDGYFEAFPRIKSWIDGTLEAARKAGFVATYFGRRRPVPDILSSRRNIREAAERIAVNTPVQGTSAELIKIAMARIKPRLEGVSGAGIILQVHDELIAEVPEDRAAEAREIMKEEMLKIEPFETCLAVSTGQGRDWLEASH